MWPAIIGTVLGGLIQQDSNRRAQNSADEASASERRLTDRQVKLFDTLYNDAQSRDRQGEFDPRVAGEKARGRIGSAVQMAIGNAATKLRTLGYKPGDSVATDQLRQTTSNGALAINDAVTGAEQAARDAKTSAYRAADPSILNPGIQSAQRSQMLALGQQQSLAPLISSVLPFLGTQKQDNSQPFSMKRVGGNVLASAGRFY
jgi:hypothetical protein